MSGSIGFYDAKKVDVIIGGVILSGFSEKEFVKCGKDEDNFKFKFSAKGDSAAAKSNNNAGEIEITLNQTSPFVSYLNGLADKGTFVPAWVMSNNENKEQYGGSTAVITKPADASFSEEITDRKYKIKVLDYVTK